MAWMDLPGSLWSDILHWAGGCTTENMLVATYKRRQLLMALQAHFLEVLKLTLRVLGAARFPEQDHAHLDIARIEFQEVQAHLHPVEMGAIWTRQAWQETCNQDVAGVMCRRLQIHGPSDEQENATLRQQLADIRSLRQHAGKGLSPRCIKDIEGMKMMMARNQELACSRLLRATMSRPVPGHLALWVEGHTPTAWLRKLVIPVPDMLPYDLPH